MLKKFLAGVLAGTMLFSSTAFAQSYNLKINSEDTDVKIIDGKDLDLNAESLSYDYYDLYFIPVKAFYEKLGFSSKWNAETKTVTFNKEDYEVSFTADSDYYNVNGSEIEVYYPAKIVDGCMYVIDGDAIEAVNDFYALNFIIPQYIDDEVKSFECIALNDEELEEYNSFLEKFIDISQDYVSNNYQIVSDCLNKYDEKYNIFEVESIDEYIDIFKNKFTEEEQKEFLDTFKTYLEDSKKYIDDFSQLEVPKGCKTAYNYFLEVLKQSYLIDSAVIEIHNKILNDESYDELIEECEDEMSKLVDSLNAMFVYYNIYDYYSYDDYDYDDYDYDDYDYDYESYDFD